MNTETPECYEKLYAICNKIHIARNIGMNPDIILEFLEELDAFFREENTNNQKQKT